MSQARASTAIAGRPLPPHRPKPKPARPKRRRRRGPSLALFALAAIAAGLSAIAFGYAPPRFNPLAPPVLTEPDAWFLDARLARLRRDRDGCSRTLTAPVIAASPIADAPHSDGCGWTNSVRVSSAGGARLPIDAVTCEMAAALALWVQHVVQPVAATHFSSRVVAVQNFGGYSCRNIIGNKLWSDFRSQHATANALDISAVTLADGRRIAVKSNWQGDGATARFLREIHDGACRYFRAVLGPDYNAAHHDHFHFDRGHIKSCR